MVLLVVLFPFWIPWPGKLLTVENQIRKADCIVVLRGDTYHRTQQAVELYRAGYAPKIVLSPLSEKETEFWEYQNLRYRILGLEEITTTEYAKRAFQYFGMENLENLEFTPYEITSTFDEALATREWMRQKGYRSMLLVASAYHMRRTLILFGLVFRGTGIQIYPVTAPNPLYHPERWWLRERDVKSVLEEYVSLVFNLLYHFVFKKHVTPFDTV